MKFLPGKTLKQMLVRVGVISEKRSVFFYCRRVVLFALLAWVGVFLYNWLPPVERWRVPLHKSERFFYWSPDGRYLFSGTFNDWGKLQWPLRKMDAHTGQIVADFPRGSEEGDTWENSSPLDDRDCRTYWAGLPSQNPRALDLVNLKTGEERRLPIEPPGKMLIDRRLAISPRDELVAIFHFYIELHPWSGDEVWTTVTDLYELPDGKNLGHFELDVVPRHERPRGPHPRFSSKGSYLI